MNVYCCVGYEDSKKLNLKMQYADQCQLVAEMLDNDEQQRVHSKLPKIESIFPDVPTLHAFCRTMTIA